ncbi:MAG: ABC transporter ATP-binding protein [Oscillospiraceae bacterium]|nr:ABC transporter ATP-binding protein [Oscillospiraceae bacterium]
MEEKKIVVKLDNITKSFEDGEILKPINLDVYEGEFLTFLGPSGCGKTTTLRIIAGFETPTSGKVLLDGQDVTELPPYKRNVNTVFQNYALFPHMNIFDNVAFGLVEKKTDKKVIAEKVNQMLEMVQLGKMGSRKPSQLSGGQKQRVAIARALANDPKVLLLDEPLGALDMKLRKRMQLELKALQKSLGITFIYVTHDQEEALTMSDRIVVMNKGKFEQIGTAREIYEHPKTKFVADFIGESNIFEAGVVENKDGIVKLVMENGHVQANGKDFIKDEIVYICVRPENVHISTTPAENFTLKGYVTDQIFVGNAVKTVVSLPNGDQVKVNMHPLAKPIEIGTLVNVFWDEDKAVVMHTTEDNVYDLIEDSLLLGNPGGFAADEK